MFQTSQIEISSDFSFSYKPFSEAITGEGIGDNSFSCSLIRVGWDFRFEDMSELSFKDFYSICDFCKNN